MRENRFSQSPRGITALAVFFALGALISSTAAASLLAPGGALEPMWRLNPAAREHFSTMGGWAPALLFAVSLTCAAAAVGFWRGSRWGYRLGLGLLVVNLIGDVLNVALGREARAAVGVPIVVGLLWYLIRPRVRRFFHRYR